MTGKGLVNGIEVEFNISADSKNKELADLLGGGANWIRFTHKGIDTVIQLLGNHQKYSEKAFDVYYRIFFLYDDDTEVTSRYEKLPITDESEYDGFYNLSDGGLLYPHISFKSPFNGICLDILGERLFNPYTGEVINPVLN